MLHVGLILFLLWLLSAYNCCHLAAYFISFIYLYLVMFNHVFYHLFELLYEKLCSESSDDRFESIMISPFGILGNLDDSCCFSLNVHIAMGLNLHFFSNELL